MNDPDSTEAKAQLPDGVLFGSAMSTHKAQGSQFDYPIVMAERGYKNAGVVQGSNVYTAVSRAREKVFIVGKPEDFAQAATTPEIHRETLLKVLLSRKASHILTKTLEGRAAIELLSGVGTIRNSRQY